MAVRQPKQTASPWDNPVWPKRLPDASGLRLRYGAIADELVVRFSDFGHTGEIVVPISTPRDDYAGLIVATDSGAVVGVHVYPLVAFAVQRHPSWRAAAGPSPAPEVAAHIVRDIKVLFDRFGIDLDEGN